MGSAGCVTCSHRASIRAPGDGGHKMCLFKDRAVTGVGDMQALSVSPSCLQFSIAGDKVVMRPNAAYTPKVVVTPFRNQVIELAVFSPPPFATAEEEHIISSVQCALSAVSQISYSCASVHAQKADLYQNRASLVG